MAEVVYPPVVGAADFVGKPALFMVRPAPATASVRLGLRTAGTGRTLLHLMDWHMDVTGAEHLPRTGGVVVACNHVSYFDYVFPGLTVTRHTGRYVRFLAKREIFDNAVGGPFMRSMNHISVDRSHGGTAYDEATAALSDGEVIGVFPEATISRSFTVNRLKTGAARLAADADPGETTEELRERMSTLAVTVQRNYPERPVSKSDEWWQPTYLGGSAPESEPPG